MKNSILNLDCLLCQHSKSARLLLLPMILLVNLCWGQEPALLLANSYRPDIDIAQYLTSEKLDGVRAFWDGKSLLTRGGHRIAAPAWFIKDFPSRSLDGELWIARGQFDLVSGAVRRQRPDGAQWQRIKYMVFDLPGSVEVFQQRFAELKKLLDQIESPYLRVVEQQLIADIATLFQYLQQVVAGGGEGLMLHRSQSYYRAGRSDDLIKLKLYQDAEAVVIGYRPGKGRHLGVMGSLLVLTPEGIQFRLGTGFTDQQRRYPPPLGSVVTFKYFGKTKNNKPRFASFLRVRHKLTDRP